MTNEEKRLVRLVVGMVRKLQVEGIAGVTMDTVPTVKVGRIVSQEIYSQARCAADLLFDQLRRAG